MFGCEVLAVIGTTSEKSSNEKDSNFLLAHSYTFQLFITLGFYTFRSVFRLTLNHCLYKVFVVLVKKNFFFSILLSEFILK